MPRPSVIQLREFYASPLGKLVRRYLTKAIRESWPELGKDTLCGVGYANPVLRSFYRQEKHDQACVLSLMSAAQGATVWPEYGASRAVLYEAGKFPLRDNQVNRLLLVHALEHSADPEKLMAECWRVLTPGGRMMVVVPSRISMWSSAHDTPFAWGQPYTMTQLQELVCEQFTHIHTRGALGFIPSQRRWLMRTAALFERLARLISPMWGGVWVMEVEKQIYAGIKERKTERTLKNYVPVPAKPALSRHNKI